MIVKYTEHFLNKLYTRNYPLSGFIACVNNFDLTSGTDPLDFKVFSDPYLCNTFIEADGFVIQFDVGRNDVGKVNNNRILLFYEDRLVTPIYSIDDFKKREGIVNNEQLFNSNYKSKLAGVVYWNSRSAEVSSIYSFFEIFRLPYVSGKPICSFEKLNGPNKSEVNHYNDLIMGQNIYQEVQDRRLMSSGSGKDQVRKKLSSTKGVDVNGRLIIKPNGIIQI